MMRRLGITPAVLITAVLALLLVAYVFAGTRTDRTDSAPHCASAEALDQIKAELFRRAAEVRGAPDARFANVGQYSVVRAPSRMFRRHHGGSDKVTCTGSIVLDLPPGVAVAGGRRSVGSSVAYELEPVEGRTARLLMLSKADAIVLPLATLFQTRSQTDQPLAPITPNEADSRAPARVEPSLAKPEPPGTSSPAQQAAPETPSLTPRDSIAAAPRKPPTPSQSKVVPKAPAPAPVPVVRPSFNCRYAHTRGERAVCGNADLASLDRQMAAQFFRALSVARPGQRAMLQRSRVRFLRYRDSCGSEACMADAYRGRMREINDIMAGAW